MSKAFPFPALTTPRPRIFFLIVPSITKADFKVANGTKIF